MVDLGRATTFADASADRNIPAEVCIAIYVQRVLGRRRTDANVCAGGCIIPAADATQHKSVTLTDQGVSADGCGIPEAVDTSAAVGTDARKERASRVGKERHLG